MICAKLRKKYPTKNDQKKANPYGQNLNGQIDCLKDIDIPERKFYSCATYVMQYVWYIFALEIEI